MFILKDNIQKFVLFLQKKKGIYSILTYNNNYQKLNQIMEKLSSSQSEDRIQALPSKTDSSETTNPDWIFEKYKTGLISTVFPFQLFESKNSVEMDDESSEDTKNRKHRGPYRKYTFEQKMIAVEKIQRGQDVKNVSRQFGIPRRNLLRWKKNGCERKEGGGRPTDQEMELILFGKIKNRELTGQKQIRNQAILISRSQSFKASKGWFLKFCRRFDISLTGELTDSFQ